MERSIHYHLQSRSDNIAKITPVLHYGPNNSTKNISTK